MIILVDRYARYDVQNNPHITYVFGDNDMRAGFGGQASACRGLPNTIGIRTKKKPSMETDAFYTDIELNTNIDKINEDVLNIKMLLLKGFLVVFPKDGFGTGRAQLRKRAPKTYAHLNNQIVDLLNDFRPNILDEDIVVKSLKSNKFKLVPKGLDDNQIAYGVSQMRKVYRGIQGADEVVVVRNISRVLRKMYGIWINETNSLDRDRD